MALSPMMQQYFNIKEENPETILFFRLGDFYEMFFDDAKLCARELELTLTGKDCGLEERAPMCGVPFHSADTYIQRLIEKGYKVAVCEQTEDPKSAKGLVKRDVVKIVTPGTILEGTMLDETKNNYVANICQNGKEIAISYADISTGECYVSSVEGVSGIDRIIDEIIRINPSELVLSEYIIAQKNITNMITKTINTYISTYISDEVKEESAKESIIGLINESEINKAEMMSLIELFAYITNTQKDNIHQINNIEKYELESFMRIDNATRRNLEILESNREKIKKGSLLWVLDKTNTSMGARKLKKWLEKPLLNKVEIDGRLDTVEILKNNMFLRDELVDSLKNIYDLERIISKIVSGNTNARDLLSLKNSIYYLPNIKATIGRLLTEQQGQRTENIKNIECFSQIYNNIDELKDVYDIIENSILEDAGITIKEGNIIKPDYNKEVFELKQASTEGKNWIMQLEAKEKELTGIKNLKVGYNRVFGYYIEVTKSFLSQAPLDRYIRKQTLTGAERYITEELKEIENKVLGSEEKLVDLEYRIFCDIRKKISQAVIRVQRTADAIAMLDVLCCFAMVAENENYVKPNITEDGVISILEGRHPVVEKALREESFIPNDTYLDLNSNRFNIITGPNMAGKSTYMRQVAIISYMAQIGSFVPAKKADICIVDRIFTRVGASDDLAMGESTFMVEMTELSNILKNATEKSLVILDEIGRGTSTYDGLSIAWATVEYICDKEKIGCKALFATHYHELTELGDTTDGINNYSVAVKEKGDDVIFLRKIVKGAADESYGIYVAKLAGIPKQILHRSKELLKKLEETDITRKAKKNEVKTIDRNMQVDMFNYKLAEVGNMLDRMSLDELTAKEALDTLYKLKDKLS